MASVIDRAAILGEGHGLDLRTALGGMLRPAAPWSASPAPAVLLGINPHTLRGRMRKLGIDWHASRRETAMIEPPP